MPRTIVLTLASPSSRDSYGRSEYWSVSEDGRICDGLCWDEMLDTVVRITLNQDATYNMQTLDEHKDAAKRRAPKPRIEDALRQLVHAMQGKDGAGPLQPAIAEAEAAIEEADEQRDSEIPF